jgi:2-oxoisovalerate ferredoxin oxidoreductase beta subunit
MAEPYLHKAASFYDEFVRKGPPTWTTHYCPGCGHGIVHKLIAEALDDLGLQDRTILVNSVGCSVFAYYYLDVGNVQVPHGRCPAVATAIKRARPDSVVIGYQGDGDLAAIGGNEILHAANRGENVTIFFVNNAIYGMTGGQMAPTTLLGMRTTTTPEGRSQASEGFPIRVCELLANLDAPYYLERVALGDARNNRRARAAIRKALGYQVAERGFSLVEILAPCPTGWKISPVDAARFAIEEMPKTFPLGVLRDGHAHDLGHPRRRVEIEREALLELLDIDAHPPAESDAAAGAPIADARIKIAGFGGQGVLAMGLILAHAAMRSGRHVAWIPSYGPEMRGGTANCSVTVSDREIGSPIVTAPTDLVALNGPSLERFAKDVVPGGRIYYNASMIDRPRERPGISYIGVRASEIADQLGEPRVANVVLVGAMLAGGLVLSGESILAALPEVLSNASPAALETNARALDAGREAVSAARA